MVPLLRTWLAGYSCPGGFVRELDRAPAPQTGLYGSLLRAGMDSLLLYLPLALMGRRPSLGSALAFLPTERYYLASVFFMPPYFLMQWLFLSAGMHVVLRLSRRPSDFDRILNLNGATDLVVGAVLVPWDWLWILAGWHDEVLLGISHLVLVTWGIVLGTVYLNRSLEVPVWLAVVLQVASVALAAAISSVVVRAPV
ncbi:MAG: hypothetical protein JW820_13595 [Spirochaetales bacterium]|nr:hypothetical protein [Spirochaetales bacterium]